MTHRSWTAGVERRQLSNGLTALVQADADSPAVAVVIHVKAGFFDEPDRWQGISHVLEHMFFKGTPRRGVGQIAAETKALGGYLNASTGYDTTSYYVVLPATGFEQALNIQADALRNATIDGAELSRELKVIIEEAKRKLDTPSSVAYETLHALLFDRHRIRRWRIGHEEALAAFTRDDVLGYYGSRYVPSRVIVSVVGAVVAEQAFRAIEREFADWIAPAVPVEGSPEEPWRTGVRVRTLTGDVRQADLALGWRGVPPLDKDAAPLDLAARILSAGRGGWLYRALRQPGLVTSIGAYHYSPSEVGVFSVTADLAPRDLEAAVAEIAAQVRRLATDGPNEADLIRARTMLEAQWSRSLESVEGRASRYAAAEALGGLAILDREFARLLNVAAAEIRDTVARYLTPEAVSAVAYLPSGSTQVVDPEWLERAFRTPGPARTAPSSAATIQSPGRRPAKGRVTAGVTHVVLPGVDLLLRPKQDAPLVSIGMYRSRLAAETAVVAGVGALAVRSAVRGAGGYSADDLVDLIEGMGGSLGATVGADWFGVATSVLPQHLDRAAALVATVMSSPRFDETEVLRERATLREEAVQAADDMLRHPMQLALAAAFGNRGYGLPVKGTVDSIDQLTARITEDWFAAESDRVAVVVAGQLDVDKAIAGLGGAVEPLGQANQSSGIVDTKTAWTRQREQFVEGRKKAQTAIAMVFPGPSRTAPDRYAAEVLAAVASGLGGRLFTALRDQRSLAYTVFVSSWQRARRGALIAYIATTPAREGEAREQMLVELARFAKSGVSDDELKRAINYLSGQALVQRQTTGALASELADAWLVGSGLDELADPTAGYRAVTREAVREVAARNLLAEARAEGVVRGSAG